MLINLIYITIILVAIVALIAIFIKFKTVDDRCHNRLNSTHPLHIDNICRDSESNLQLIKGIGKILEKRLNSNGIYCIKQIANWNEEDIKRINKISAFPGRVEREKWVEQAKAIINSNK